MTPTSLPIIFTPDDRESPEGFLLRTFAANQVLPMQVYRWLSLPWSGRVLHHDLELLSSVTQAPLAWLRPRVPTLHYSGRWQLTWQGRHWRSPTTLRGTMHQMVCPMCIHAIGLQRLEWGLGWFCACPIHKTVLMDQCANCAAPIRWNRSAVDVCGRCRRHLRQIERPEGIEPLVLDWLAWMAGSLSSCLEDLPLPASLRGLFPGAPSIDGVWRIISAFGAMRYISTERGRLQQSTVSPTRLLDVATRGLQRLARAMSSGEPEVEVHVSGLRLQELRGSTKADRALARHLLDTAVVGGRIDGPHRLRRGDQLEMFS